MLNTGLRTSEILGLKNEDIDMESKTLSVKRGVKEIFKRDGTKAIGGNEIKIGKPKTATYLRYQTCKRNKTTRRQY